MEERKKEGLKRGRKTGREGGRDRGENIRWEELCRRTEECMLLLL